MGIIICPIITAATFSLLPAQQEQQFIHIVKV